MKGKVGLLKRQQLEKMADSRSKDHLYNWTPARFLSGGRKEEEEEEKNRTKELKERT